MPPMSGIAEPLNPPPEAGLTPPGRSAAEAPDHADLGDDPSHTG